MITEMNRLSVLLYHGEKESFLQKLREVGVVHIEQGDRELSPTAAAINGELTDVRKVIADISVSFKGLAPAPLSGKENAAEAVKKYLANSARIETINNEITSILKEKKRFDPWGDIKPETLEKLKERGLYVTLFELPAKEKTSLKDLTYETVKETPTSIWIAAVGENAEVTIEGREAVHLPRTTLAELNGQEASLSAEKASLTEEQKQIAAQTAAIQKYRATLQDALNYELASSSMDAVAKEKLFVVNGWVPREKQASVEKTLDGFSCWYEFNKPAETDDVPVQFKNSAFANKYEVITRLFALPKYQEIDPTPFFAPFYMLFFGLCLGDVGYGFLVLAAAILMYTKVGAQLKPIAVLGMMLGFSTLIGGFLLNGFFGVAIFNSADATGIFAGGNLSPFSILKTATVQTSQLLETGEYATKVLMPMIPFSLFLGVFQLLFAMVVRVVNRLMQNNWNIQYALMPIGTMFLTVAATMAVTKANFLDMGSLFEVFFGITAANLAQMITPEIILVPTGIGLALLFLFNNPQKNVFIRLPLGLWELYQFGTGLMGDGLSYIRLFALGLAGGLLGASFNQIALMITGGEFTFSTPLVVITVLILILGHGINFLLAALGSFVHPLRLTFVEFYKHIEFQGGAKEYKPLAVSEA